MLRAIPSVVLLCLSAPALAQSQQPTLARAIALFNNFDDARAGAMLKQLIASSPNGLDAAKAHVYLGLIAVNALDSGRARAEFLKALAIEPTIEAPYEASPKARLVFEQAQKQFSREDNQAAAAARPKLHAQQVPLGVQSGPIPASEKAVPPPPSHVPAYVVGALGLVVLGTGVGFGVWQSSTLNPTNVGNVKNIASAQSQAGTQGLVADICFGVGGALAVTSIVLFITEATGGSDAEKVSLRLSASPGAASAVLSF